MSHSFAQKQTLSCSRCSQEYTAEIWLIVDIQDCPDLVERIKSNSLHWLRCPKCGEETGLDAPLLLFFQLEEPHLVFSPQESTNREEDQKILGWLLGQLSQGLGSAWQDEWLDNMVLLPKEALSILLRESLAAAWAFIQERKGSQTPEEKALQQLFGMVEAFIRAKSWAESQQIVEDHPELLTDTAFKLLASLVQTMSEKGDQDAEDLITHHLKLLHRCREVGIDTAFGEITNSQEDSEAVPAEIEELINQAMVLESSLLV